jgi:tetratricopeptide (TPR) repeat protein
MSRVHIDRPQYCEDGSCKVVSTVVTVGAEHHSVWYRTPAPVACGVEPVLVASLFAAMRTGLPLHTEEPVSPLLLSNLQQIQEIFHSWDRSLSIVPVEAPAKRDQDRPASGVGCFYSGGVDSFYSVLKHASEISQLIFVHGFDLPLDAVSLRARVRESLYAAASELKLPLVEVETNLRSFTDRYLRWGFAHGAALASVALLLSRQIRMVYVPSSNPYAYLVPWGSHPLIDPLWSTYQVEFVHDGCEATRMEKVASVSRHQVALRHLRVCWENRGGAYNCGQCEKCLRTMIGLHIVDALNRCPTFDRSLNCGAIARMRIKNAGALKFFEESLEVLERVGRDHDLANALRNCLNNQANFQAAEEQWEKDIHLARSELAQLIPEGERLILIDENYLGGELVVNRHALPFTERGGQYWGPPADDAAAVAEFNRQRAMGARFLVIAWPAFWWLEHYAGLHRHLYARYPCLLQNPRLVVFDLSGQSADLPSDGAMRMVAEV